MPKREGALRCPLLPMRAILGPLLLLAFPGFADAPGRLGFAADTVDIHATSGAQSGPIGKLLTASPVTALGPVEDGWRPVAVAGWTLVGAERALQAAPGIRVTRAALGPDGVGALSFGASRDDPETGQTWTRARVTGWIAVDTVALSPDLDTLWRRAEALFATRCTTCHVRRVPAHYTANQWTSHLKVMGPRTGLSRADQALIRVFLQYHSADAAAVAAALTED
jgi:hypothetical protein